LASVANDFSGLFKQVIESVPVRVADLMACWQSWRALIRPSTKSWWPFEYLRDLRYRSPLHERDGYAAVRFRQSELVRKGLAGAMNVSLLTERSR